MQAHGGHSAQAFSAVRAWQGMHGHIAGKAVAGHGQRLRMHAAAVRVCAGGLGALVGH